VFGNTQTAHVAPSTVVALDPPSSIYAAPLARQQETGPYTHFGRRGHWAPQLKRDSEILRV